MQKQNIYSVFICVGLVLLQIAKLNAQVSCMRIIKVQANGEIMVNMLLKKDSISGFGKIEELLPEGCTAKVISKGGAVFSFVDNKAKFVWLQLPNKPEVKVSYKITCKKKSGGEPDGNFAYLVSEVSMKVPVTTVTAFPKPVVKKEEKKISVDTARVTKETPKKEKTEKKTTVSSKTTIVFKVQVGAFKQSAWKQSFTGVPQLSDDKEGDFTRYYSGNFKQLKDAEKRRDELVAKGHRGAFIVVFKDGKRMSLKEAGLEK